MIYKYLYTIFLLALCVLCISCESSKIDQLEQEVEVLHDEVMPFLDDMKRQRRMLVQLSDANPPDSLRIRQSIRMITQSDSLMWAWMDQYKRVEVLRDESMSDEKIEAYLVDQRQSAKTMNTAIKDAMAEASEILGENKE